LPFVVTPAILFFSLRKALYKKIEIDVNAKKLSLNSVQTVFAAFLTSIIVSGFPLLLGASSPSESQSFLGELIFIILLTRAPLIVVVASLQSYFVILFRGEEKGFTKFFLTILGIIFSATLLLMIAFSLWGVYLFELITSQELRVDGIFLAVLVCSSGLIASLTVTGAALLSKSKHSFFVLGWLVAAIMTLGILFTGLPIIVRIELSLILAPAVGVFVHILLLISLRKKKNN
jgi:O-antigen/teichoic acid export membrane protein